MNIAWWSNTVAGLKKVSDKPDKIRGVHMGKGRDFVTAKKRSENAAFVSSSKKTQIFSG